MRPIQVILAIAVLASIVIFFGRLRSRLVARLFFLAFVFTGLLLVTFPDLSSMTAHRLGVGRGVDLVIYLSLACLGLWWLAMYTKIQSLASRLTDLTRTIALGHASRTIAGDLDDSTENDPKGIYAESGFRDDERTTSKP